MVVTADQVKPLIPLFSSTSSIVGHGGRWASLSSFVQVFHGLAGKFGSFGDEGLSARERHSECITAQNGMMTGCGCSFVPTIC